MAVCYFCKTPITPPVYRSAQCPQCGHDLKICRNCRFYSPGLQNDCVEPSAEPVKDKENANFCGYFEPAAGNGPAEGNSSGCSSKADDARNAFNSLFGD